MKSSLQAIYQQQQARLAYRHGLTFAQQGAHDRAIAAFSKAIAQNFKDCARAQVMRGISRAQSQDIDGAIADFEAVIATSTNSSNPQQAIALAHHHRGLLRQSAGNEAGALADWSAAIALRPTFSDPHYHRALLRLSQGQHAQAMTDLNAAIAANLTFAAAYALRGNLRHQLGDLPGAVADWELAVCNDFTLEEIKHKLADVQQAKVDDRLSRHLSTALAAKQLTVEVHRTAHELDIHVHREVGVGVNYYKLPDLLRDQLVPLQLPDIHKFRLVGYVADVRRPEWSQVYDLYKGQPCPPSNWESALSTLILFPPFGIPAFIQAAKVKKLHEQGRYLEAVSASKSVKGLCVAGSVTLGFFTLLPLGYAAYDSMKAQPTFTLAEQSEKTIQRPYQNMRKDKDLDLTQ